MSLETRRIGSLEALEPRQLMAADTLGAALPDVEPEEMILVRLPNVTGDISIPSDGYGISEMWGADSFSYAIELEMEASKLKEDTMATDPEGSELQEPLVAKNLGMSSSTFNQSAITGDLLEQAEIGFVQTSGEDDAPAATDLAFEELDAEDEDQMAYVLERCFIKSWSASGDADESATEEVSFYYNKLAMSHAYTID